MKRGYGVLLVGVWLTVGVIAVSPEARAALGEPAESISADCKALSAARRGVTARTEYTVQEVVSDANVVREYLTPSGIVFAIAWNGLSHPDLTPLLGSYVAEYRQALRKTPRTPGRRHFRVRADRVVVEKWGHMRNLQGRAYDPALIPPGVSIDEIK